MSGADEAEASRLRVGPYLSDTESETVDATANARTQLIPQVTNPAEAEAGPRTESELDGPTALYPTVSAPAAPARASLLGIGEPARSDRDNDPARADLPKVRAVARRAPAALPALATDGPRDVPASAKTTVDRRRRDQGRDGDSTGADSAEVSGPEQPPPPPAMRTRAAVVNTPSADQPDQTPPPRSGPATPTPAGSVAEMLGQPEPSAAKHSDRPRDPAPTPQSSPRHPSIPPFPTVPEPPAVHRPAFVVARPDAATAPAGSTGSGGSTASAASTASAHSAASADSNASADNAAPAGSAGSAGSAVPVRPAPQADATEVFAAVSDPPAAPRPVTGAVNATVMPAVRVDPANAKVNSDGAAGPGPLADPGATAEQVRPGPPMLQSDSWDLPPADRENELYQGRRRNTFPWTRVLLILGLLVVVGAIFAVPMALRGSSSPQPGASDGTSTTPADALAGGAAQPDNSDGAGELVSAASSPGGRNAGKPTKPAVAAAPSTSASSTSGVPTTSPGTPVTSAPPPSTFAPVTLQAEAASLTAKSWQVDSSPGCAAGSPVVRTGKWSEYSSTPGAVTFTVSVPTAASYKVTIYSVVSYGTGTRRAEIYVNNASVTSPDFPEGCLVTRSITVSLNQGNNAIRFTNQNARGPSIDRIEISKV